MCEDRNFSAHGKILGALDAAARRNGGIIDWCDFVKICLYLPQFGYYARKALRVGKEGADFYTSQSLNPELFGRLVSCAAESLMGVPFADMKIFELGNEPECALFEGSKVFRLGDEIKIDGQNVLVFANELPDAQPFSRYVLRDGRWFKRFIVLENLSETEFAAPDSERKILDKFFPPENYEEGFCLDYSFSAAEMFGKILDMPWRGALIFFDYFRSAAELADFPRGTARGYYAHCQFSDLLEKFRETGAGTFDITFSPPEEPFLTEAKSMGAEAFCVPQENFIVRRCFKVFDEIVKCSSPLSKPKRDLAELVGAQGMGSAFKVLCVVKK